MSWLRDAMESFAWDGVAHRMGQKDFAHIWAWERDMKEIEEAAIRAHRERVYDWEADGL